jgi:DNA-binding IclR family transcriptional regulator
VYSNGLKEVVSKGFASIKSKQYEGLHAISFPIVDMNGNAVAAMSVPMLARIDGTKQFTHGQVEELLRESVENLSMRISTKMTQ